MKYLTEDPKWVSFYPRFNYCFFVEKAAYFDERPTVHTSITQLLVLFLFPFLLLQSLWFLVLLPLIFFGWGTIYIHLPIRTGIQDCYSAAWGFNYHNNIIFWYVGGSGNSEGGRKWKTITMPWDLTWVRTSLLLKDMKTWEHETKGNNKHFYEDKWKDPNLVFSETHPYVDASDNTIVNATITVKEREWRPLGFKWTSLFAKTNKEIQVEFDQEVGFKKGTWKGGCIGCSYDLIPNETPKDCLMRMQKERKF